MLEVVVSLEESLARDEFDEDATDRPHVARVGPACACLFFSNRERQGQHVGDSPRNEAFTTRVRRTENDLGCAVVPRRHDLGVVLLLERGAAKVDQLDARVFEDLPVPGPLRGEEFSSAANRATSRAGGEVKSATNLARYHHGRVVFEEDVLRFQVGVDELRVVYVYQRGGRRGEQRT